MAKLVHFFALCALFLSLCLLFDLVQGLTHIESYGINSETISITILDLESLLENEGDRINDFAWSILAVNIYDDILLDPGTPSKIQITPFSFYKSDVPTPDLTPDLGTVIELFLFPCESSCSKSDVLLQYSTSQPTPEFQFPERDGEKLDFVGIVVTIPTLMVNHFKFHWALSFGENSVENLDSFQPASLIVPYMDLVVTPYPIHSKTDPTISEWSFSFQSPHNTRVVIDEPYLLLFNNTNQPDFSVEFQLIDPNFSECSFGYSSFNVAPITFGLILYFSKQNPLDYDSRATLSCPGWIMKVPRNTNAFVYNYELRWTLVPYSELIAQPPFTPPTHPLLVTGKLKALSRYHKNIQSHPFTFKYSPFSQYSDKLSIVVSNLKELLLSWEKLAVGEISMFSTELAPHDAFYTRHSYTAIILWTDGTQTSLTSGLLYNSKRNVIEEAAIVFPPFNYFQPELIQDAQLIFNFMTKKNSSPQHEFNFRIGYGDGNVPYNYCTAPTIPQMLRGTEELINWEIVYSIPTARSLKLSSQLAPPISKNSRKFSMSFTTNSIETMNYDITITAITISETGPFTLSNPSLPKCFFFIGDKDTVGTSVATTLAPNGKSIHFSISAAPLPTSTNIRIKCDGYSLVPQNDDQYYNPIVFSVDNGKLQEYYSTLEAMDYRTSTLLQPAMSTTQPGPDPQPDLVDFDFKHVFSPLSKYVDHIALNLTTFPTLPESAMKMESFVAKITLLDAAILRPGNFHFITTRIQCFDQATGKESSSTETDVSFSLTEEAAKDGTLLFDITIPPCEVKETIQQIKKPSIQFIFSVFELTTSPLLIQYAFTHQPSKTVYSPSLPPLADWIQAITESTVSMTCSNSTQGLVPKPLHSHYASFTPIVVPNILTSLNEFIVLSSNATGQIANHALPDHSFFEHFQSTKETIIQCDFGKFGKIEAARDAFNHTLTFNLKTVDPPIVVGDTISIHCPDYFIRLTDESRVLPLSWSLRSYSPSSQQFQISNNNDIDTFNPQLQETHALSTWYTPQIFFGPPQEESKDEPKPKTHTFLTIVLLLLLLLIIVGTISICLKKGLHKQCFKSCRKLKKAPPVDIIMEGTESYESIQ